VTNFGISFTAVVRTDPEIHASGALSLAVTALGGVVAGIDVVESGHEEVTLELTCFLSGDDADLRLEEALNAIDGCAVEVVMDSVMLIHIGGKLEIQATVPMDNRIELARAYTPGVARVCLAIAADRSLAREFTIKRNTVAVVTDGSAVLGLGDLGPEASMPVMEGKAALFKRFADIDAWPIALDTNDVDEIVRAVQLIAPGFGGINLEDISAPRCFEIERRLRETLTIPVMHDDQHGTAVVVLAALKNAARYVKKDFANLRIVMVGAGAAGAAVTTLLMKAGVKDVVVFDSKGPLHAGRGFDDPDKASLALRTNPRGVSGTLPEAMVDADVFIGVSQPNLITAEDVSRMAKDAIVFALSNPTPEINPVEAHKFAAVVATGRSDYPNQINNVLAFPGIFRGMLDCGAHIITDEVLVAAANAIADVVTDDRLSSAYIIPSVFDADVAPAVAAAVAAAATK